MVEKFFRVLSKEKEEVTPTVRKLKGLLKGSNVDENDYKSNSKVLVFLPKELLRILKVKNGF